MFINDANINFEDASRIVGKLSNEEFQAAKRYKSFMQ